MKWDREVVFQRIILGACFEELAIPGVNKISNRLNEIDAVLSLTCLCGMKMLTHLLPEILIIHPVDMIGNGIIPLTPMARDPEDKYLLDNPCVACGHCVISYTGGICPKTGCTEHNLYEPCTKAPKEGMTCGIDPGRDCIWKVIVNKGCNLEDLKGLEMIHKIYGRRPANYLNGDELKPTPNWLRKISGKVVDILPQNISALAQNIF